MSQANFVPRLSGYATLIDNAISRQHDAEKFYRVYAYSLIGLGVVVIMVGFVLGTILSVDTFKWFLALGGGFVSTLSVFPIKQILDRRERITGLGFLKVEIESTENDPTQAGSERFKFAIERLKLYLDTILGAGK
jgi:hypothetical protein